MSRPAPFPKPIGRGRCNAYVLNAAQEEWLRRYFPTVRCDILQRMMGVSPSTIHRLARGLGLRKSDAVKARIWRANARRGRETCSRNGYYESLRGTRPSPQCAEATMRYWEAVRAGGRLDPLSQYRKDHPRKYAELARRASERRKRLVRQERLRLMSGQGQLTRLNVPITPYTAAQRNRRWSALRRGYWVYEDCSERGGERWNIYYDEGTERAARFEANLRKDGFNVLDGTGKD